MSNSSRYDAKDFLSPDTRFATSFDDFKGEYDALQYQKGLETGNRSSEISISVNDTWNANGKDHSYTTSYEKLGYHRNTVSLLRGFLDSHCPIHVYRWPGSGREGLEHFVITWDGSKHVINDYHQSVKFDENGSSGLLG